MLADLLKPIGYLNIQEHGSQSLSIANWRAPFVLTLVFMLVGYLINPHVNIFGDSGILAKLLGFIQSLPGFYLAALAAVATFGRQGLDDEMPGIPPTAEIDYLGRPQTVNLTRRRFLCMMFAYLTAVSIALTVIAIGAISFAPSLSLAFECDVRIALKVAFVFGFSFATAQMLVITMWGLFYLGERIHTPDS